jgi:putative redox protein
VVNLRGPRRSGKDNRGRLMLEVKAMWRGGFKFDGVDSQGRPMKMDASVGAGGEGDGFRPAELPLMGLAGCTGMDTVEILLKMREPLSGFDVRVTAEKKEGVPPGYKSIRIDYVIRGRGLSRDKVERAVRLSEEKYCTVWSALSKAAKITHTIGITEE